MKILMIIPYVASTYGGTSTVVNEIVKHLGRLDVDVDLITTNANASSKLNVPLDTWINNEGYRIKYFSCWHKNDWILSLSLTSWLFKHVADYDLVHTQTIFAPLISLTSLICQLRRIPYIITPHGMLDTWALAYKAWKKKIYYNLVEKQNFHKASAIQVLSRSEADRVSSLGLDKTVIIANGIYTREFEQLPKPEIFYKQFPDTLNKTLILFLGRIDPKKGLDLLASAFAKVRSQFPDSHLIIAGPDMIKFLPTAMNYFRQEGCLDAVTFTGILTGSLKYSALAAASVYVAPSYSEGFSMSVLEGMASGLPCVITTGCNFPEAAEAEVAHVVDINADAIGDALIQCLSHPQQSKAMGDRAREFIFQNYIWERSATKLIQIYSSIIQK